MKGIDDMSTTTKAQTLEDLYFAIRDVTEKLSSLDYVSNEYRERCRQYKIPDKEQEVINCIRADYYHRLEAVADALEAMDQAPKKTAKNAPSL